MENLFENILDDDEKLIKVLKPNKLKYYFASLFGAAALAVFILCMAALFMFVPEEGETAAEPIYFLIPVAVVVVLLLVLFVITSVSYNKRYYAYSNKRVIIRCGFIGVDYKSLDMDMIGAINVNVSLIDKILRKNTGTISFGSVASPMTAGGSMFSFYSVLAPYDFYKEIKLVINEKKATKTTQEIKDKK